MKKKVFPNWNLDEYIASNRRLDNLHDKLWDMTADAMGAMHRWFCPQLFEQICILDPDLERLYKTYEGTERQRQRIVKHIKDVCMRKYLLITAAKFSKINDQMVDYFDEMYKSGAWAEDKKTYEKYPNKGDEPATVNTDAFLI